MRYSSGRRSRKTLMEERIPLITEKSRSAAMISSPPPAWAKRLPPGVNEGAAAGAGGVGGRAVAQGQEGLALNGPGPGQGVQMHGPLFRPLAHHKEQIHPLDGQGPGELREADVVADDEAAVMPLQGEAAHRAAGCKKLVLPGVGEEMGLIIEATQLPARSKT